MSSSRSSPTNTTATTTNAQETNLAATNTQGVTLVGTGNKVNSTSYTTNVATDQGAVQAGTQLGQKAIAANTGIAQTVSADSFSFADHALDVLATNDANSATLVQNYLSQGASFLNQTESAFTALSAQDAEASNTQFGNIETTLANIAQSNDTSQASQALAANKQTTQYIILGIIAVAIVFIVVVKR